MEHHKKTDPSFSLYEFRSWLSKHKQKSNKLSKHEDSSNLNTNELVESRLGIVRLQQKITEHNEAENVLQLAEDFKENGGKIIETIDLLAKVEVGSGTFLIPKIYTKGKK